MNNYRISMVNGEMHEVASELILVEILLDMMKLDFLEVEDRFLAVKHICSVTQIDEVENE